MNLRIHRLAVAEIDHEVDYYESRQTGLGFELEDELVGNAYHSDKAQVPTTMAQAREVFATSSVARAALGDEVVDHYVNMADVELAAYRAAVTDWELRRGFERL